MKLKIFIPPSAPLLTGNGGSGNREWWGTPGTPRPPTVYHYHRMGAWETSRKIQFCHQPRTRGLWQCDCLCSFCRVWDMRGSPARGNYLLCAAVTRFVTPRTAPCLLLQLLLVSGLGSSSPPVLLSPLHHILGKYWHLLYPRSPSALSATTLGAKPWYFHYFLLAHLVRRLNLRHALISVNFQTSINLFLGFCLHKT